MLTKEEIEYLFIFCRKHYVQYYDVQVELVDHLANAIERELQDNADLKFNAALDKVYKSFGYGGFAALVKEKEKAAVSYSRKLFWTQFVKQFHWPAILTLLVVFMTCFTLLQLSNAKAISIVVIIVLLTAFLLLLIKSLSFAQMLKRTGKKFVQFNSSGLVSLFMMPFNVLNIANFFLKDQWLGKEVESSGIGAHLTISFCITSYIAFAIAGYKVIDYMNTHVRNNFPEVFQTSIS